MGLAGEWVMVADDRVVPPVIGTTADTVGRAVVLSGAIR